MLLQVLWLTPIAEWNLSPLVLEEENDDKFRRDDGRLPFRISCRSRSYDCVDMRQVDMGRSRPNSSSKPLFAEIIYPTFRRNSSFDQ